MDNFVVRLETLGKLTTRQIQVLRLRCEGKSQAEIAAELFISVHTVKSHFQNIYQTLGLEELNNWQRIIELQKYCPLLQELDQPAIKPENRC